MNQYLPLIIGFVLTSVLGGALGYFFQTTTWRHQHRIQLREQEIERAAEIFEEISRLLDRRLYRTRQLHWRLKEKAQGSSRQDADQKMEDYREVVYEWNDNVHRNLALLHRYFGEQMRNRLDYTIGTEFVEIGIELEGLWNDSLISEKQQLLRALDQRITKLSHLVYHLNIDMIRMLQSGSVGLHNPAINR
jgi:hypothetical protein